MIGLPPSTGFVLLACTGTLLLGTALPAPANSIKVGKAAAVNPATYGQPPGRSMRTMQVGDPIVHNERINTDQHGQTQLLLADGTTFTVGPNSDLTINSFVYNPNQGTAKVVATLSKGAFRFIGGRTSKTPGGATVHTPVGTVGIRGGIANIDVTKGHGTPAHFDLLFGHSLILRANNGRTIHIDHAGHSIGIAPNGTAYVEVTPRAWARIVQQKVGGTPGRHGGAHAVPTDAMVQKASILSPGNGVGGVSCGRGSSSNQSFADPAAS